jgi:hypothetical protein
MIQTQSSNTGYFWTNHGTPALKAELDQASQAFALGLYSVDEFLEILDEAAEDHAN